MNDDTTQNQLDRVVAAAAGHAISLDELVSAVELLAYCADYGKRPIDVIRDGTQDIRKIHRDVEMEYITARGGVGPEMNTPHMQGLIAAGVEAWKRGDKEGYENLQYQACHYCLVSAYDSKVAAAAELERRRSNHER